MYIIKRTVKPYYLHKQIHYVALFSIFLITSKHTHTSTPTRTQSLSLSHTHTHTYTHILKLWWPDTSKTNFIRWKYKQFIWLDGHWWPSYRRHPYSHARMAHNGLLQNRMEDDLCWMVPRVSLKTWLVEGLSEYDIHIAQGFCFGITTYKHIYF